MAALIVDCVPATGTVVGLEVLLDLAPKRNVVADLVSVNSDDHSGQPRAGRSRGGLLVASYE